MIDWALELPWPEISYWAEEYRIDPHLIAAIVMTESGGHSLASRYEPQFQYLNAPERFAKALGQTKETEVIQQKTSYGLMQIMGATARDLKFTGYLSQLYDVNTNLKYGSLYLASQMKRYKSVKGAIAAYNAGSLRLDSGGKIVNQQYIDRVVSFQKQLKLQPA